MGACFSRPEKQPNTSAPKDDLVVPKDYAVQLSDFELLRIIGKGAFGKVKVVKHKTSGRTYALKYISKAVCVQRRAAANVVRERKILATFNHPLVCNLRYAFQDSEYLYLVSDLMLGGDLRFHLLRKTFTQDTIRHWIAEVASALSYCHSRTIVHRDVKPDNILLTADGHAKLADFNISTQIKHNILPQSRSGSLYYMAPEVQESKPYDYRIDFWSLGVVLYEAIYGFRPFAGKNSNEVTQNVLDRRQTHPRTDPPISSDCIMAIDKFLEKLPETRFRDISEIRKSSFFSSLDWDSVSAGTSKPIFAPGDGKNFDAAWELEEILLHDSPLEACRSSAKRKPSEIAADEEMFELIDNHFTMYDSTLEKLKVESKVDSYGQTLAAKSKIGCESVVNLADTSFVNHDEKSAEVLHKSVRRLSTMDLQTTRGAPKDHKMGLFKLRKKEMRLPEGVLSMRAGGRIVVKG